MQHTVCLHVTGQYFCTNTHPQGPVKTYASSPYWRLELISNECANRQDETVCDELKAFISIILANVLIFMWWWTGRSEGGEEVGGIAVVTVVNRPLLGPFPWPGPWKRPLFPHPPPCINLHTALYSKAHVTDPEPLGTWQTATCWSAYPRGAICGLLSQRLSIGVITKAE